jgi:two-component system chemotaxis family response regulator WspR
MDIATIDMLAPRTLPDRRALGDLIAPLWAQARSREQCVSLIMIAIDDAELYSEYYGTLAREACVRQIRAGLRCQLRGNADRLAHVGDSEFALILPGVTGEYAADIAERLRAAIAMAEIPHATAAEDWFVTISLGTATLTPSTDKPPELLLAAADAALHAAQKTGRNRVAVA